MKNFILGADVAYATDTDFTALDNGAIGVYYNEDGEITSTSDGSEITKEAMLVYGRDLDKGGPVVIPLFKNRFSYVKGEYEPATTFEATITIPAPTVIGDYSIIVAKKGVKFNERNKWTAMVFVKDVTMSPEDLAAQLADAINKNSIGSGVTAEANGVDITITAIEEGVDYEIIGADLLFGAEVVISAPGIPAYGDAKYVQDLAEKAAADAGFEYTYRDDYVYLYPNYPLNPLASADAVDTGFTIFTLRFAEPRDVKTHDEVVNQLVQVAFPTGASAIGTFEAVCEGLAD